MRDAGAFTGAAGECSGTVSGIAASRERTRGGLSMETRNRQTSRGWGWRKTRPTLAVIRPEGTVAYIGGSDTLPAPLTREEEQTLFARMMREPDAARQTLIEHNLRLVAHVVKKYQGTGEDTDDLISIGTIGLIKAVTTFNPQKASRLSTYAARCIENELLMYFRAKKKHSKEVSLYEPIGTDKEGNEINLLDVIESAPVDIVEDCYIRENTDYLLRSLKKVLSDKEYQVICCRYGLFGMEEETQREIARKLCISRSYVSRIEKTALQKLRGLFPQMQ